MNAASNFLIWTIIMAPILFHFLTNVIENPARKSFRNPLGNLLRNLVRNDVKNHVRNIHLAVNNWRYTKQHLFTYNSNGFKCDIHFIFCLISVLFFQMHEFNAHTRITIMILLKFMIRSLIEWYKRHPYFSCSITLNFILSFIKMCWYF